MTANEGDRIAAEAAGVGRFLTLRATISQGWYLAGLGAEILILFVGIISLAGLNNPTGGGSLAGALIFPLLAIYIHVCLVAGRLRDAGASYPILLGIVVAALPFVLTYLLIEYIEYIWILMLIAFFVPWLGPAFAKRKAASAAQA
jgi:uncharacterized membrane protein YhaH (DUF805 family)